MLQRCLILFILIFFLDDSNKIPYQKIINNLGNLIEEPTILKKYFLREKLKTKNEFYAKEIDSDFQLRKLLFASLIDSKAIEYNLKTSLKIIDKLTWGETKKFIKNNFSFQNFLILKKDNNNIEIIKYPKELTEFKEIKFKVNFQEFNKEFPFLFVFLYHFEPRPEFIFFNGVLRRALKSLVFKDLSDKSHIYSYLDKYYAHSIQKLFTAFIIPYQDKQKLEKEILEIKENNFLITQNKFKKFKNEFREAINKNCFDIFRPSILNKIFRKEIPEFDLKEFKKEMLKLIESVNYNQFQVFLEKLNFIFNI